MYLSLFLVIISSAEESDEFPPPDREAILVFLKSVVFVKKPEHVHRYTFMWVTSDTLLEIAQSYFNVNLLTAKKLEEWINTEGFIGKQDLKHLSDCGPQNGRYLYVKKQKYRGNHDHFL